MSSYFVNLMIKEIVPKSYIYNVIRDLLDKINSNSSDEEFIDTNEEIMENISIILTKGK